MLLPSVDHLDAGALEVNCRICAWRTNEAKKDLSVSDFLDLCRRVVALVDSAKIWPAESPSWRRGQSVVTISARPQKPEHNQPRYAGLPVVRNAPAVKPTVNLQVTIAISDELEDQVIRSTGSLDLASGEIFNVVYDDYDASRKSVPADAPDYEFTSGTLSYAGKDVEFSVKVDKYSGRYSVSPSELLDIKVRAAKLFAGIDGKALASGGPGQKDVH